MRLGNRPSPEGGDLMRTILMIGFNISKLSEYDRRFPKRGAYLITVDPLHRDPQYMESIYRGLKNPWTFIRMPHQQPEDL